MMIVPLPPFLLDLLITLNISAALTIVVATLYVPRALDFSSFPSLLLLHDAVPARDQRLGHAPHPAPGRRGPRRARRSASSSSAATSSSASSIFLILIVIQFVVITNGAGRVAEVAARFTLDAMPGKQMAIDADLNAGQITDEEARKRRAEISREADFYGAMDGASKFVKGDAIAGILITAINLVGGIVIGVIQQGMPFGEAAHDYSLLTVGDGLVAQIPALLISVATGIIVTRSASEQDLGTDIAGQILDQRKAPMVAGAVICALRARPGPAEAPVPRSSAACSSRRLDAAQGRPTRPSARRRRRRRRPPPAAGPPPPRDQALEALAIDPLELAIGFGLVPLVDEGAGGSLLPARRRGPPPDRRRARHRHPVRPHPRRRRPRLARVRA